MFLLARVPLLRLGGYLEDMFDNKRKYSPNVIFVTKLIYLISIEIQISLVYSNL